MADAMALGSSQTISITSGNFENDYFAAWIDWNQDYDWDDAGEKLGEFSTSTFNETQDIIFTVPTGALTGTTKLPVRCAYNAPGMDPCTDYGYGETEDYTIYVHSANSCIGVPTYGTTYGDFIDGVVIGNINNIDSGGITEPPYADNTFMGTAVEQGSAQSVAITSGDYAFDDIAAWIDCNQDGDYDDAGEKLGEFATTTSMETQNIAFTVPPGATLGMTTMRVRCVWNSTPLDPCTDYEYGETEDYTIYVHAPGGCIPTPINGTTEGDFIDGVVLGTINNTGTGGTGGPVYRDYTSMSTDLFLNGSGSVAITSGDYVPDNFAAWIDWNQDGDFDDTDEKLGEFGTTGPYETQNIAFTVPPGAALGMTTMRVRCVYGNAPLDPCTDYSWGNQRVIV